MNLRRFRKHLAGPALLLQLIGTVTGSMGLVLCVEATGHVALEDFAATTRCCPPFASATSTADDTVLCSSTGCIDTPLSGVVLKQDTSRLGLTDGAVALAPVVGCPPFEASATRTRVFWNSERFRNDDRTLRSVVLLI